DAPGVPRSPACSASPGWRPGPRGSRGGAPQAGPVPARGRARPKEAARGGSFGGARRVAGRVLALRLVGRPLQAVAEAAHGHDADVAALELAAQPVHVDLDRVVAHLLAPFAQVVDDLLLADQAVDPLQQDLEHAELAGGEVQRLSVQGGGAADLVVGQRAELELAAARAHAA